MSSRGTRPRAQRTRPDDASRRRVTDAAQCGGRLSPGLWIALVLVVIAGGVYAATRARTNEPVDAPARTSSLGGSGQYVYQIGDPGPGKDALPLNLPSTSGGTFDLASYKGQGAVLLYFQEGLTCQPCWDQLKVIQADAAKFQAMGIVAIVSITTDPVDLIGRKVQDEGITLPVLSDSGARASSAWHTNRYQMMGMGERNGHTFILVGTDGKIRWRADYGGSPNYTMYVPTDTLLAQMREGALP